jgi:hypothetical protein
MTLPNFFIAGAAKCGTTAMATWLAEHPQVFMSPVKEPHHFASDMNYPEYADPHTYERLFDEASAAHRAVGEASVWYLYSRQALPSIMHALPDSKFIVMLRNPVEMAVALHEEAVFTGYENEVRFEQAWTLQEARREGRKIPFRCPEPRLLLYGEACRLGEQVERMQRQVDASRMLLVFLEDVRDDARAKWLEVLKFLGLDDDGRIAFESVNQAKERRIPMLKWINDVYRMTRERAGFPGLNTGVFEAIDRLNRRVRPRGNIREPMREELIAHFTPDVRLLERVTGRDLRHWLS